MQSGVVFARGNLSLTGLQLQTHHVGWWTVRATMVPWVVGTAQPWWFLPCPIRSVFLFRGNSCVDDESQRIAPLSAHPASMSRATCPGRGRRLRTLFRLQAWPLMIPFSPGEIGRSPCREPQSPGPGISTRRRLTARRRCNPETSGHCTPPSRCCWYCTIGSRHGPSVPSLPSVLFPIPPSSGPNYQQIYPRPRIIAPMSNSGGRSTSRMP